jgi:S-adenosylmethionine:tRNA ribosyltransferase-isomerase
LHAHAHDLPSFLDEGDLVVVNTSGTLAAALDALGEDGTPLVVHLSQRLPAELWLVELRRPNGRATEPWFDDPPGGTLRLVGGGFVHLATRFESSTRLWVATLELPDPLLTYLAVHGRPIRYSYVTRDWPLDTYHNVYAPAGSADAERRTPFTLSPPPARRQGRQVTPLVSHRRSSLEANEHPYPEWRCRRNGRGQRPGAADAVATGTTVVRARISRRPRRAVHANRLDRRSRDPRAGRESVDGLLTGWHERGVPSTDARGDRRPRPDRRLVRGGVGRGLPLARVRRRPPHPP